jgi:hypothetical protein
MRSYAKCAMALAALLVAATPATALTVTNGDKESWTIAVTIGEARTEYTLAGGEVVSVECDPSCSVHLVAALGGQDDIGRVTDAGELMIKNDRLKVVE